MIRTIRDGRNHWLSVFFCLVISALFLQGSLSAQVTRKLPEKVPPKRTSQIQDGFGINSDLPRDPYLPWNRWWWTRMFDAGFKWIRIGQYENSSDYTSWDWIEQKRGVYASSPRTRGRRRFSSRQRNGCAGSVALRQPDVHRAQRQTARRQRARAGVFSQRRPQHVLGVLASGHAGTDCCLQQVRRVDRGSLQRPHPLLGVVERARHRILESLGRPGAVRAPSYIFR